MRSKNRVLGAATIGITLLGALILVMRAGGAWSLSATNTDAGVEVNVFQGSKSAPTFTTVLPGHSIPQSLDRVTRDELPPGVGQTTFVDVTMAPGRWTVDLNGVELDIMPARMTIDGTNNIAPSN